MAALTPKEAKVPLTVFPIQPGSASGVRARTLCRKCTTGLPLSRRPGMTFQSLYKYQPLVQVGSDAS